MKPFKGIIKQWDRHGEVVVGICVHHADEEPLTPSAVLNNGIVKAMMIQTSPVHNIEDRGSFAICETKNSFYVLVEPRSST